MWKKIQQSGSKKKSRQTAFMGVFSVAEASNSLPCSSGHDTTQKYSQCLSTASTGTVAAVVTKGKVNIRRKLSPSFLIIMMIRSYRWVVSPWLPRCCRFSPSCSQYAITAFERHGFFVGLTLTLWRLVRCQPLCRGGYDPVPKHMISPKLKNDSNDK